VAWQIGSERAYALEGSCFIAGAAVQWLRDGLGLIRSSSEVEALASSVPSSDGVVFVPALSGLGAPHWDPDARGLICGLTRGSSAGHIARATLEAIAFQVDDLIVAVREDLAVSARSFTELSEQAPTELSGQAGRICDSGIRVARIRVDGGAAQNNLLMQFQSDVSNLSIERPIDLESTARGAAMLAGVGAGVFGSVSQAAQMVDHPQRFEPRMTEPVRQEHVRRWRAALSRARSATPALVSASNPASQSTSSESHGN
jgi:glycerol kinase